MNRNKLRNSKKIKKIISKTGSSSTGGESSLLKAAKAAIVAEDARFDSVSYSKPRCHSSS